MAASSISETKRVRYLLGLCSPAEREHIELEYLENEDAFQEMLAAEDDLIDAYARGELAVEERRKFENSFKSSLHGRDRVQFARAFAGAISVSRPVKTNLPSSVLYTFHSHGLLRAATIAAVIVLVGMLARLVIDRTRLTNELRELRSESAQLSKRTAALRRSGDIEGPGTALLPEQPPGLPGQPDKPRHRERGRTAAQPARQLAEIKNDRETIASKHEQAEKLIHNQDASLGNALEVTQLPVVVRKSIDFSRQPGNLPGGYVSANLADQTRTTVDGIKTGSPFTHSSTPGNTSSGGATIRVTAKDPNGNLVRGATVTLTDAVRNFTRSQSTNKDGAYIFNAIPPGTYSIEVEAPGFKTSLASGLAALADTPTVVDMQLEVGSVSETVAIIAGADTPFNTSDATIGNPFERTRITKLPLNANNVVGLLSLQPGVSCTGFINGRRVDQSSITLDGGEAAICLPSTLSGIRFHIPLETAGIHEEYGVTIKTADGRHITSVDWTPLTPNQTIIDTPLISTGDLPSGEYVLLLIGKEPDGSFVKVTEYSFKVIKY